MFIIVLRQFWSRGLFFGMLASPKNGGGAYVDKLAQVEQTGMTGAYEQSDRSGPCSRSGNPDRSDRWV